MLLTETNNNQTTVYCMNQTTTTAWWNRTWNFTGKNSKTVLVDEKEMTRCIEGLHKVKIFHQFYAVWVNKPGKSLATKTPSIFASVF